MLRALLPALLLLAAAPVMAKEGFATSKDGIPIAWTLRGDGSTTLVFVHCWSCDQTYWRHQVDAFADLNRVVTIDIAGHGKSGLGRGDWTMAAFGGDIAVVMEELDLEGVILIGHSMGGPVVVEAARQARARVKGLVWVDVNRSLGLPLTDEEVETIMMPFREDYVGATRALVESFFPDDADPELVAWVIHDMTSAPPDVALDALENAITFDPRIPGLLAELDLPVVAINTDRRATDLESMYRHEVEVMIMSGVGHFLMMEDAERFTAFLAGAIDRVDGDPSSEGFSK